MPDPFWSIDDYIIWRCGPDEDFTDTLSELRERLVLGEVELTGWRCSWDPYGRDRESAGVREIIPPLTIVDLKFEPTPHGDDGFALIPVARSFYEEPPGGILREFQPFASGVIWADRVDEKARWGPRIDGWGALRLRASEARAIWKGGSEGKRSGGRPSCKNEIEAAFYALQDKIDWEQPLTALYPLIREKITGFKRSSKGLGSEAIRKVIRPLFDAHKTSP
jgi:hypothetical protein